MSKRKKDIRLYGYKLGRLRSDDACAQLMEHMNSLMLGEKSHLLAWSYVLVKNIDLSIYDLSGANFFKCKFVGSKLGKHNAKTATFQDCEVDVYQATFSK